MTLTNPTDQELDAAFAEHVAGLKIIASPAFGSVWMAHDTDGSLYQIEPRPFTRSFDAVLPWLEREGAWAMDWCPIISNRDAAYNVWLRKKGIEALGPSLPRAAVIALLRAHGVEVEFDK